jgi:hypothetical protein
MARSTEQTPEVRLVADAKVADAEDAVSPTEEAEEFGLRVAWQSEEERLAAAEFLVATRMQEQVRRRVARAAMTVREQTGDDLTAAIHERPPGAPEDHRYG